MLTFMTNSMFQENQDDNQVVDPRKRKIIKLYITHVTENTASGLEF